MAPAHVDRNLFGLIITIPAGHPAGALLNRLPRSLCLRPHGSAGEYIVGLTAEALPPMRKLYKMENVEFTQAAVAALAHLKNVQQSMSVATADVQRSNARPRVEITPDVSPSLRGLEPTLHPFPDIGANSPTNKVHSFSSEEIRHDT